MEGGPAAISGVRESKRSHRRSVLAAREELGAAALWLALGGVLAALTTSVVDWYVMTDELLYSGSQSVSPTFNRRYLASTAS